VPMHLLGVAGHPRRYSELTGVQYVAAMASIQKLITVAAVATISAQLIFLLNFFWSMFKGSPAGANPWECTTLEWTLSSPPPSWGFGDREPIVNHGAYVYSVPGNERDYVMQDAAATR